MSDYLKPRMGKNFALVRDYIEDTILLIDFKNQFVLMSDSSRERELGKEFIEKAHGDILSLGFGIGFVLFPLLDKPEVKTITVVEKHEEILDLCASQLEIPDNVFIVHENALTYQPDREFDVIFDDCLHDTDPEEKIYFGPYEMEMRLRKSLKPGGIYIKWSDDGRYRI